MEKLGKLVFVVFVCVGITMFAGCSRGGGEDPVGPVALRAHRYQGRYEGTFSGEDRGVWAITIDSEGDLSGYARSTTYDYTVYGSGNVNNSGETTFNGSGSSGVVFRGKIDSSGGIRGSWYSSYYNMSGAFRGNKTN